jgi:uncharacterized protein YkwD
VLLAKHKRVIFIRNRLQGRMNMPRKLALALTALAAGLALVIVFALAHPTAQTSADPNLDTEEQAFVTLINDYRQANGLGPLAIDWEMQSSSDWMSNDMGVKAYFSHTDSLGRDPWTRMCAFGYCYNTWMGENIAAGYTTASDVFTAWKNSPGHNANMLGSNYIAMGISRVYVTGSPYGWYWTNDFGGVQSNAAPPTGPTNTPTPTPSASPIHSPTPTPSPSPTLSPTPPPTATATPTPTPTLTCPNGVVPPWHVPPDDSDCDGFTNSMELFIGTDPNRSCGPGAWPPDINGDGVISLSDVLLYATFFNSTNGAQAYSARYDLNADGRISLADVLAMAPFFNKSCVP